MLTSPSFSLRTARERGVVLLLALIALLLISAVGAAILFMSSAESSIVGNQRIATRVFYAGAAGLEEARYRCLPATPPPQGINFSDPTAAAVGVPVIPCTASEQAGTLVPCNTASVPAYPARPEHVLYIMNSTAVAPPAPGSNPGAPASATNDPFLTNELPGAIINTTGSIQPGVGTGTSIPYPWVRIHLKTERASGQDINFDGTSLNDEPIFYYLGRQYLRADLQALGLQGVMPPPWGPPPPPNAGRPCAAAVCASPVYMLTAYATVPSLTPSGRILRSEVAAGPAFAVDAGVLSQPPIEVSGTSLYIGYDGCDIPDCPPGLPPYDPVAYPEAPGLITNCNTVVPLQAEAPAGSKVSGNSAETYPEPPCPPPGVSGPGDNACVQENAPYPYNLDELINALRPLATPLTPGNYTGLALGSFPFADIVNGTGANPVITHVDGNLKCTAGCSGAGILIVEGDFEFNASMEFWGVIVVRGNVSVLGGGTPTTGCNIYGAMITGGGAATDVGGAICFRYNSCAQKSLFQNNPFLLLAFREVPG